MQEYIQMLNQVLYGLESARDRTAVTFEKCPAGELQSAYDRGRLQYLQVTYENGKRHRHGINKNKALIRGLARKAFLQLMLETLEKSIQQLSISIKMTKEAQTKELLLSLHHTFPELTDEYYFDPNHLPLENPSEQDLQKRLNAHRAWASLPYEKSSYRPQGLRIITSQGLKVRTKSEALIVEKLYEYGIPFRYEQILHLDDSIIVPDFTFMTASDHEIYWEHAGMLTKPTYSFRHYLKMLQYESCGIFPWQDLIVTYDTNNEMNLQMIDAVIQFLLLPQL